MEICLEGTVPVCVETQRGDLICECLPIYEAGVQIRPVSAGVAVVLLATFFATYLKLIKNRV